jgi:hypothetical protein
MVCSASSRLPLFIVWQRGPAPAAHDWQRHEAGAVRPGARTLGAVCRRCVLSRGIKTLREERPAHTAEQLSSPAADKPCATRRTRVEEDGRACAAGCVDRLLDQLQGQLVEYVAVGAHCTRACQSLVTHTHTHTHKVGV